MSGGVGLEKEIGLVLEHGLPNGENQLGNHREHFDVNSVELIQTGPTASPRQSRKELFHHRDVDLLRTVEDNAVAS